MLLLGTFWGRFTRFGGLVAVLVGFTVSRVWAADPSQVDPTKQNEKLAPSPENGDNPLAPDRPVNQRAVERNSSVQELRFKQPDAFERKEAVVGEKRAPIDIGETRAKTMIDRKEAPKPELKEREKNRYDGEKFTKQPRGDDVKKYEMADKYQGRFADAKQAPMSRSPTLEKRTTFDKINRFIFRRNGPGSEEGNAIVRSAAGGENPTAAEKAHKIEQSDWLKGQRTSESE